MRATLNCDMGESYGIWSFGTDVEMMDVIDVANVACGFHASDFTHMRRTARLAKAAGVRVGAHPSLPDRQGFGRREMALSRDEAADCILYQVGALSGFLNAEGAALNHIKPHGALYGMAARQPEIAEAVVDIALLYGVPIFGLPGTLHETVARERGATFVAEFFADLDYDPSGRLLITKHHSAVSLELVAERVRSVVSGRGLMTQDGGLMPITAGTICVHSDTPNAVLVARTVAEILLKGDGVELAELNSQGS